MLGNQQNSTQMSFALCWQLSKKSDKETNLYSHDVAIKKILKKLVSKFHHLFSQENRKRTFKEQFQIGSNLKYHSEMGKYFKLLFRQTFMTYYSFSRYIFVHSLKDLDVNTKFTIYKKLFIFL